MAKQTDTRTKLIQAAADLIWKSSYHGTGVDAICQASGVQKGCFYHHFESKEVLTLAALEMIWSGYRRLMDEAFSPVNAPIERFEKFLAASIAGQEASKKEHGFVPGCPIFGLGSELSTQEPNIRKRVDEILSTMRKYFVSAIREGQADGSIMSGDANRLASAVLSLSEGSTTMARIQNDLEPMRAMSEAVIRLLRQPQLISKAA
jgi:TetR/AcrR family transcriptional regulator, transcriptional repressor for nem operon